MSGKKTFLARTMSLAGLSPVATRLRSLLCSEITILAYHRVLDIANDEEFDFDLELISASVSDFKWQMSYVRRHYTPISFKLLLDHLDGKQTLPPRPILISFDDGFDDNYHHAFPVLRSLAMPATIFISTGYIGQERTLWFDWLVYLCNKAAVAGKSVRLDGKVFSFSRNRPQRHQEMASMFYHVKRLPDDRLRRALMDVEQEMGIVYPEGGFTSSHPLNWDQIREMAAHGIEFGSHTVTHPILANTSSAQLREELTVSKARLEQELGRPVDILAYPVGQEFAFNADVIAAARAAGYRIGVSYIPGVNATNNLDMFRLRRLHVERYVSRYEFQCMLALPGLYSGAVKPAVQSRRGHKSLTPIPHTTLADADLGEMLEGTQESLAARLGFDEYVAVAHTLEADQVFWKGLLTGGPEDQGAALVLETRLGALSGGLSRHFKTVFAWHASASAAAITRQYADRHQIHNIRIVISDPHEDLDVDGERFDAIVFYGPSQDMTGQWGSDATTLLKSLVRKIPLWLADGGVLVVGENNRCAYRLGSAQKAGGGRAVGVALPGLGRWLHKPRYLDIYLGSSPMTASQMPTPDLTLRDAGVVSPMFPKNTLSSLKERMLHSRMGRLLWPSFLLVASDRPRQSFLQDILGQRTLGQQAGWDGASGAVVKRILAGNSGTTVLIAGPVKGDGRDVIVRLPSKPSGRRFCRINAQALRKLAQTSLSGYVPRLLVEGVHQDQEFTVESRCPGNEADYGTRNLDRMLRQTCEVMGALHRQTARPVMVTEAGFQERVAPLILDLSNYCSPDVQSRFHRFMEALRIAMVGRTVSVGFMHGDFKLGNFLFDRTGKLTALIDWDGFSEDGYPVFDYLTLLTYKMAHDSGSMISDVYLQSLLPWKLPPACQRLVGDEVSTLLIDDESFLLMRIVFWFSLNYYRFDPLYKYHPAWQRESVLPMLSAFEKIHQSGWRAS